MTEYNGLDKYFEEIGQIPFLSEEEKKLQFETLQRNLPQTKEYQNAREKIILSHLRLVAKISYEFLDYGLAIQDLISEGTIGLMKCIEGYVPSDNAKFTTYAVTGIRRHIKKQIIEQAQTIVIPYGTKKRMEKLEREEYVLKTELGRSPKIEELANYTGLSLIQVKNALRYGINEILSLESPLEEDYSKTLLDVLPNSSLTSETEMSQREIYKKLFSALRILDDKEKHVIRRRFFYPGKKAKSLESVAEEIGLRRETTRKIQNKALEKVRVSFMANV